MVGVERFSLLVYPRAASPSAAFYQRKAAPRDTRRGHSNRRNVLVLIS